MEIIINNIDAFKLTLNSVAKDDVRYYLNGFLIEPSKKRMVATDGHVLTYAEIITECDIEHDVIIKMNKEAIPALTKNLKITDDMVFCYDKHGVRLKIIPSEIIDGKFPDYQKAIYSIENDNPVSKNTIDPKKIIQLLKFAKNSYSTLSFSNEMQAILIDFSGELSCVKTALMPVRL